MHSDASLGGPVWLLATFVVLVTVLLGGFVFIDSMRPARAAARSHGREPLWVYTLGEGLFLGVLVFAQFARALPMSAAVAALSAPLALVLGIAYLLRVVYPKADTCGQDDAESVSGEVAEASSSPDSSG